MNLDEIRKKVTEIMDLVNQDGLENLKSGDPDANTYGPLVFGDYRRGLVVRITSLDHKEVARYGQ